MAKNNLDIIKDEQMMNDGVIDVSLDAIKKKAVRINGDNSKIIYLNLSDLNIVSRLNETYPKLKGLEKKIGELSTFEVEENEDVEKSISTFGETLRDVDAQMRGYLDYIFDSAVSDVCAGAGSMYDPFDGELRYEHIINALTKLYENSLNTEFKQMQARINKHTSKYHN